MPPRTISLRTALLAGGASLGLYTLGVLTALATPGVSGGKTRDALSFAGTLRGVSGKQQLTFTFKKDGAPVPGCAPQVTIEPDASGAFVAPLPLDGCPGSLFDGADVTLDVRIGDVVVAPDQAIHPVPYARYADRVGTPDCPLGYERDPAAGVVLCRKGVDEIVKVGQGTASFWIDRYEASVVTGADGLGTQYGVTGDDYPATFPKNGQWSLVSQAPLYAVSKKDVRPSGSLTWFQAVEACAASGKVLPGRQEWLRAVQGTPDPGDADGAKGECVTGRLGPLNTGRQVTGMPTKCVSRWGAQDMIGNISEWTDEWYAGLGDANGLCLPSPDASYNRDVHCNITSKAYPGRIPDAPVVGLPVAGFRGGNWSNGVGSGAFTMYLDSAPSSWSLGIGFRCAIRR